MASTYKTPGVYVEEISKFPPSVAQVATAIPAFIGYTEKADESTPGDLTGVPTRITSLLDYVSLFGGPNKEAIEVTLGADNLPTGVSLTPSNYRMYPAIQMYFSNGGGPCYIVSVGAYSSPEAIDSDELAGIDETSGLSRVKKIDEVTLILFPDAEALDEVKYYDIYEAALGQCGKLQDRFTIVDIKRNGTTEDPVVACRNQLSSDFLKYGAAYWPWLTTTLTHSYDETTLTLSQTGGDLDGKTLAAAKAEDAGQDPASIRITSQVEGLIKAEIAKHRLEMPPGPAVAGVYAAVDSTRGVWKAPANVSLSGVIAPVEKINDSEQGDLNVDVIAGKSINAIRSFTGKGVLIWGARTLAGNDNEWRYIPVRRFFNMVEESVKKATSQFVFEPNDANTWVKVRAMIENFLNLQWRAGALAGAKPEQAFYVRVALGETMTAQDILEGRMIVEIGMAAVRPAEFIILQFSHKMQES